MQPNSLETSLTEIAGQIKTLRKKVGISQDQLAVLAGISRRPIYLIESGKGSVRLETLIKILTVLGSKISINSIRGIGEGKSSDLH